MVICPFLTPVPDIDELDLEDGSVDEPEVSTRRRKSKGYRIESENEGEGEGKHDGITLCDEDEA